jgi:hypothetical protein
LRVLSSLVTRGTKHSNYTTAVRLNIIKTRLIGILRTGFSYQLYSSRNFPPLEDTLEMLSKLGYNNVEGFGALLEDVNPREFRTLLDKINLTMTSSHVGLDLIESDP